MQNLCPCGSGRLFSLCCNPIISGLKNAETALELMRSRYVAFSLANVDYLMLSHYSATRPINERKSIEKWARSVKWMGLKILQTEKGQADDEFGYVEFKALYLENGKPSEIHEKSLFKHENQKWVYVSGMHL